MNNQSSYFGLVDAKIRASGKDLPVRSKSLKIITNDIAIIAEVHSLVVCRLPYPMVCWVSSEKRKQEAWNGIEKYA